MRGGGCRTKNLGRRRSRSSRRRRLVSQGLRVRFTRQKNNTKKNENNNDVNKTYKPKTTGPGGRRHETIRTTDAPCRNECHAFTHTSFEYYVRRTVGIAGVHDSRHRRYYILHSTRAYVNLLWRVNVTSRYLPDGGGGGGGVPNRLLKPRERFLAVDTFDSLVPEASVDEHAGIVLFVYNYYYYYLIV